jgi:hypothetical protein
MRAIWNIAIVAAAVIAAGASPAFAVDGTARLAAGQTGATRLVLLMDTYGTGKVSRAEYNRFMEAEFVRLDVDKDGQLDVKELTQPNGPVPGHYEAKVLVGLMDADQNGKVSHREFMNFLAEEFARLDTEKTGAIDVAGLTIQWVRGVVHAHHGK